MSQGGRVEGVATEVESGGSQGGKSTGGKVMVVAPVIASHARPKTAAPTTKTASAASARKRRGSKGREEPKSASASASALAQTRPRPPARPQTAANAAKKASSSPTRGQMHPWRVAFRKADTDFDGCINGEFLTSSLTFDKLLCGS